MSRAKLLLFGTAALAAAVLFFFDPATTEFYPPCLFKTFLGAQCPGCGSLRAAHQLLHGNLKEAWTLNKPLLIALPLAGATAFLSYLLRKSSLRPR